MTTVTTRRGKANAATGIAHEWSGPVLHMALELDDAGWKLGFTTGLAQRPRVRVVRPRDTSALLREVEAARHRFGVLKEGGVVGCYEAGREGFWLHRFLMAHGVRSRVVDSASIEVNRRARRAKADRLDLDKLLRMLVRYEAGEHKLWSVVRAPTVEEEDARQLHRELDTLKRDRTRTINRTKGLLASQGIRLSLTRHLPEELEGVRLWDGSRLPPGLTQRVLGSWEQWQWLNERIARVAKERQAVLASSAAPAVEQVRQLMRLRAIAEDTAWPLVMEFFSWREFRNRREVGALAGLAPTPYQSGSRAHEQGISKAGNPRIRALAIQLAWGWLRYQPESELSWWYRNRFAGAGKRMRKIGIVALARRLLVELWRYLETGLVPAGAALKPS